MSDQPSLQFCPQCGNRLVPGAVHGLCARCLMAEAAQQTQPTISRLETTTVEQVAAVFPQLEVLELIGQGGMGAVFKVRQPKLDRFAALKLLPQSLAADPAFTGRFEREARLLAKLSHPNIVSIYDYGQAGDFFYLLMEYVDGMNLRQAMHASPFEPRQALGIVPRICDALQYAHEEGVLHRDIKPENILLDAKGRVKLVDFGIAKLTVESDAPPADVKENGPSYTQAGAVLGTPSYMAPEQRDHPSQVDHRADIYSLGVVFYELLTGELPTGSFAPPSQKSNADPRVDAIVQQALQKERDRRQHSAGEVRTQVETISEFQTAGAKVAVATVTGRMPRKIGLVRIVAAIAMSFYVIAGVLAMLAWIRMPNPQQAVVWGILAASILAVLFAIPARTTRLGKNALIGGAVSIAIWLTVFAVDVFVRARELEAAALMQSQHADDVARLTKGAAANGVSSPGFVPATEREVKARPAPLDNVPVRVKTAMVTRADLSIYINALGNIAPPNAPQLATQPGENRKSIMVLFAIPEEDVQAVIRKRDANQPLPVDLYNREMNKKIGRGSLVGVDNQIDTQTGTLQCKAAVVPVDDTLLYPNLFVNVRMLMETRRDVVQVSAAAIQRDANDSFVFVMQPDQTVVTRSVGLGAIGGDNIEITSGLSPGDIVVVDGADRLRSGSKISLSPMPAN